MFVSIFRSTNSCQYGIKHLAWKCQTRHGGCRLSAFVESLVCRDGVTHALHPIARRLSSSLHPCHSCTSSPSPWLWPSLLLYFRGDAPSHKIYHLVLRAVTRRGIWRPIGGTHSRHGTIYTVAPSLFSRSSSMFPDSERSRPCGNFLHWPTA